jgi:hypothetical protein
VHGNFEVEESMSEKQETAKRGRVALTSGDVLEGQVARLRELFPKSTIYLGKVL